MLTQNWRENSKVHQSSWFITCFSFKCLQHLQHIVFETSPQKCQGMCTISQKKCFFFVCFVVFTKKRAALMYLYIFFADGGFDVYSKIQSNLIYMSSHQILLHSGRFWHTGIIGQIWSSKAHTGLTHWSERRRIRVTTDWHNTVGFPPSWQLPLDTCVNSKFDNNHHTWKPKNRTFFIYRKL